MEVSQTQTLQDAREQASFPQAELSYSSSTVNSSMSESTQANMQGTPRQCERPSSGG